MLRKTTNEIRKGKTLFKEYNEITSMYEVRTSNKDKYCHKSINKIKVLGFIYSTTYKIFYVIRCECGNYEIVTTQILNRIFSYIKVLNVGCCECNILEGVKHDHKYNVKRDHNGDRILL